MARPRTYDRDTALKAAMRLFWRKGYARTSLSDLEAATGMKRASLYAAFGDKEALFLLALEAYAAEMRDTRLGALLQSPHPRAALEAHFRAMAGGGDGGEAGGDAPPGCLITNATVELAEAADTEGQAGRGGGAGAGETLTRSLAMIEDVFTQVITRGQKLGEISTARPARALARHLVNTAQGLRVLARNPALAPWTEDILATAFSPLDPPPTDPPPTDWGSTAG